MVDAAFAVEMIALIPYRSYKKAEQVFATISATLDPIAVT